MRDLVDIVKAAMLRPLEEVEPLFASLLSELVVAAVVHAPLWTLFPRRATCGSGSRTSSGPVVEH